MKKIFVSLVLILFGIILIACDKGILLDAPVIKLEETILSWDEVTNATGYLVKVNEEEFKVTTNSYDLKNLKNSSFTITVIAVGDGKKYKNSPESNQITITPTNKVELVSENNKYKIKVQSNKDVYGFVIKLSYNNLELANEAFNFTNLMPASWIYDINVKEKEVIIALTGLDAINVRLMQTLCNFEISSNNGTITLKEFTIDNN